MNHDEMVDLLTLIAARDNRAVGQTTVAVWLEDIGDLPFDDARRAVADHFREEPGVWLMAGHVRARVKTIREARLGPPGPGLSPIPPAADPDDDKAYRAALRAQQARIAAGVEEAPAIEAGQSAGYDDNPHVQRIVAEFNEQRDAAARRKAQQAAAEREALRAYRDAVEHLLALPDRGERALAQARDELLGDEQAAQGFPVLQALPGVMDEHRITIYAARLAAEEEPCAPPAE